MNQRKSKELDDHVVVVAASKTKDATSTRQIMAIVAPGVTSPLGVGSQHDACANSRKPRHGFVRKQRTRMLVPLVLGLLLVLLMISSSTIYTMISVNKVQTLNLVETAALWTSSTWSSASPPNSRVEIHDTENIADDEEVRYHVVFSTSCNHQQDWESYVFFYHAYKIKQPGNVTRILSGCDDQQASEAKEFFDSKIRTLSDRFHLHLTPDYSKIVRDHDHHLPYKYMNKPFGLRHWMETTLELSVEDSNSSSSSSSSSSTTALSSRATAKYDDDIVILMDPDMILLKPILHDFSKADALWVDKPHDLRNQRVGHGRPISQQDGYLGSHWMSINMTYVTGDPRSPAHDLKESEGPRSYNAGPPYLATVRDMYRIVTKWTEFAPRVHHLRPKLFAEMQGYCIAAAHLNLPHTMIKSVMVSTTTAPDREGWPLVDAIPDREICGEPTIRRGEGTNRPFVLHYCKRYFLGRFFFSKYRLRKDYLSCEAPLLTMPPPNITGLDHWMSIPERKMKQNHVPVKTMLSPRQVKREAFMLCGMISHVNEAVVYFKQNHCSGRKANFNRTYNFHDYPDA